MDRPKTELAPLAQPTRLKNTNERPATLRRRASVQEASALAFKIFFMNEPHVRDANICKETAF